MARILCVDDEDLALSVMTKLVQSNGHQAIGARDAQGALDLLQKATFDLVISDIFMQPKTGIDLLRAIRQRWPDTPTLMVTGIVGASAARAVKEAISLGAFGYLMKPFTREEVMETVQRALDMGKAGFRQALLNEAVRSYMKNSRFKTLYEAKIELAEQIYWISESCPREEVLSALRETLRQENAPELFLEQLLEYRGTASRVKQAAAKCATRKNKNTDAVMAETCKRIAEHHKGTDKPASTIAYACALLELPPASLNNAAIAFICEFAETIAA